MKKLKIVIGQAANGTLVDLTLATTLGWDNKLWATLLPNAQRQIEEDAFLRAANYIRGLVCWPARDVSWFRFHPCLGLLGPELESMHLQWRFTTGNYYYASPRRATNSETMWLRSMGCLPGNVDSLVQDIHTQSPMRMGSAW